MNVSLTPELEKLIQDKVKSGRYLSASEVVREALRLLEERDRVQQIKLDALRRELQVGIDQIERGEVVDGEEAFAEIERDLESFGQSF
jgi:antitoxin ParD1/3/4